MEPESASASKHGHGRDVQLIPRSLTGSDHAIATRGTAVY